MTPENKRAIGAALACSLLAISTSAVAAPATTTDSVASDAAKDPIPGPRSCFWLRGPVSGDPYVNIAYPDSATFYWAAAFTIPEGAKLSLEGKFPHSRYMSFISYDQAGQPLEDVADYLIKPAIGSTNPFQPGADRNAMPRDYSLKVVDAPMDASLKNGMNLVGQTRDQLNAPKYNGGQQAVIYRIYARDHGQDETGGQAFLYPC